MHGDQGAVDVGKLTLELLMAGIDDERRVVVPHEVRDLDEAEQLALIHVPDIDLVTLVVTNKLHSI
ncbi:hypothetical protein D3C79_846600 [compost metagenome]